MGPSSPRRARLAPWVYVPFVLPLMGGFQCGHDGAGGCDEDADCDTEAGQFCEFATDATEDEHGACAEEGPPPGAD